MSIHTDLEKLGNDTSEWEAMSRTKAWITAAIQEKLQTALALARLSTLAGVDLQPGLTDAQNLDLISQAVEQGTQAKRALEKIAKHIIVPDGKAAIIPRLELSLDPRGWFAKLTDGKPSAYGGSHLDALANLAAGLP